MSKIFLNEFGYAFLCSPPFCEVLRCSNKIKYYYPTAKVQITREKISRGISTLPAPVIEICPHGHNSLACRMIIHLLLDVMLCSIAESFYSLFVF